jgi:hypothetical protein
MLTMKQRSGKLLSKSTWKCLWTYGLFVLVSYQTLALRCALAEGENFVWCRSGCGSGQCHEGGDAQPIVICLHCGERSCFKHNVAWHENFSCDEYDALLADPTNFRSQFELANEEAEHLADIRRVQEDADRVYAQSLLAEDQRQLEEERREKEERAREQAAREMAQRKAEELRRVLAKRAQEEQQSARTVAMTSKPCPGCGWSIEKNDGWYVPFSSQRQLLKSF